MENFTERNHPRWFSWSAYQRLCAAFDCIPSSMNSPFLLSLDCDSRHTMKHMWPAIDSPAAPVTRGRTSSSRPRAPQDRRLIPAGQPGHIPLHPIYNYAPSAPRIPDVLQFPIESTFATVKQEFRAALKRCKSPGAKEMVDVMYAAFAQCATQATIQRRFEHAERNVLVFSGQEGSVVDLDGVRFHCTGGNWLPKILRG